MQKGKAAASPPAMILQNGEPQQYPCCNIFESFDELDLVFVTETESGLLSPVFSVTIDRSDIFKCLVWSRKSVAKVVSLKFRDKSCMGP